VGNRRAEYQVGLAPVDPITSIAKAGPNAVLFQSGRRGDEWVSKADGPKQVLWYVPDHSVGRKQTREGRLAVSHKKLVGTLSPRGSLAQRV
jgi:hypothetical protein